MRLRTLVRSAVVFIPLLLVCAGRLHAQRTAPPERMTQELNRCLTVMRVAAARRRGTTETGGRVPRSVAVDAAPGWNGRGERETVARSA